MAVNDGYTVHANTTLNVNSTSGVLANDTDADSDPLTVSMSSMPMASHGMVMLSSNGSFNYTPNSGYVGTDSFNYLANDGTVDSASAATPRHSSTVSEEYTRRMPAARARPAKLVRPAPGVGWPPVTS